MGDPDIRWHQRLQNYGLALTQLEEAVALSRQRSLSNLERQGLIKAFEFTHEVAWNLMKDFFVYQGTSGLMGSRDAVREAFQKGLVTDGHIWMEMIKSRNQTSHIYNQALAQDICAKITSAYGAALRQLADTMKAMKDAQT